jgi:asparagine synthase (glutamine-hydrolysing)
MSGLCGWVGDAAPVLAEHMLRPIAYRGDSSDQIADGQMGLSYRFWKDRPRKAQAIHRSPGGSITACAGALLPWPGSGSPAAALDTLLEHGELSELDGAFAGARWDPATGSMTLIRDPFGIRSLYWVEHRGAVFFASELKQLLAIPDLPLELDYSAIHKYLTFSFVPGQAVPIRGIERLLPGHTLVIGRHGAGQPRPYFELREELDPALAEQRLAVRHIAALGRRATEARLYGEAEVGLYLSGGLDSAAVAVWLRESGARVRAFSLDFGKLGVEREQAELVAKTLSIPLDLVPVNGSDVASILEDLTLKLDLPFGDAVTGPQYVLGRAARRAGLTAVFNGEGGDQLFGGWTSKPMIAAALYADLYDDESREQQYLRSYHRFYGFEDQLYTPELQRKVGSPGQRRALLSPHLGSDRASTFLNRIRLADIQLKGSQNILPRAERLSNGFGLDLRVPLFDRALARASFALPASLKLHGASEKYVLKLAMQRHLPEELVWRRKFGMSVPITDWALGPLAEPLADLLGPEALARRGLFRNEYVERLRLGHAEPGETRRRRVGEKLWALGMLESWLRLFVDRRGAARG